jgi:Carboxypeptidase regulatory-like domain
MMQSIQRDPNAFLSKVLRGVYGVAVLSMLLLASAAKAQTTASLSGAVMDGTGAVIPGAAVTAVNEATLAGTETVSGKEGTYDFPVLIPGTYSLSIQAKGFETAKETGIILSAGSNVEAPVAVLTVGSASMTVTVAAAGGQVLQTENGQLGAVLSSEDIQNLALESQNTLELLKVLPGVTSEAQGTGNGLGFDFFNTGAEGSPIGVGLVTNGAPNRGGTADLLDGVDINDPGCNCWSTALVVPDWTEEVSYQASNFGADVSHGPVVVSSISKAGSSQYHGEGYFYARNDILNANSWLNNNQKTPEGGAKYYYPGGSVGGPIPFTHKKVLGWFGYERLIQNTGGASTLSSHLPTAAMLGGDFSATGSGNSALCTGQYPGGIGPTNNGSYCNDLTGTYLPNGAIIGVTAGYPAGHIPAQYTAAGGYAPAQYAADLAKIWPAPNATPSAANGWANFFESVPGVHDGYLFRARVDYNFSDATKVYASYQYGYDSSLAQGNGAHIYWTPGNAIPFPGGPMQGLETSKVLSGHFTHAFSSTLTNELVGAIGYGNNPIAVPNAKAVYKTTLGYPGGTVFGTGDLWIPSYNSPGGLTFPDFSQQDIFAGNDYPLLKEAPSAYDNLIKVLGRHTVKMGVFYEMVNNDQGNFNTPNGVYSFNGGPANNVSTGQETGSPGNPVGNFVMGNATGYSENSANPRGDMAYKTISYYGDDSWKITRRFNLEYGLRFDHLGRWYDRGDSGVPVFLPGNVLSDFGTGKQFPGLSYHAINPAVPKSGAATPFLLLSPRMGLSYDIFGTGKTVVRGGWGVYRWGDQWGDFSTALGDAQGVRGYNLPGNSTVLLNQVGTGSKGLLPPPQATTGSCCAGSVVAMSADDNHMPTTVSYNFTIDQQLPWKTMLEVAYVGENSSNVLLGGGSSAVLSGNGAGTYIDLNKMPLGALFKADPKTGVISPNPENIGGPGSPNNQPADYQPFGYAYGSNAIGVLSHTGYSNYNGFQLAVVKRSDHFNFNVNYTRSKVLGTDLNENPFSLRGNYGVEATDRPNVFNASYSYSVKSLYHGENKVISGVANNWVISGITTWQGGGNLQAQDNPNFSMSLNYAPGTYPTGTGISAGYGVPTYYGTTAAISLQPVLTCNPGSGLAAHQHATDKCFAPPAIGAYGARDFPYLSGPSYTDSDLAISKTTHVTERQTFTFRASAFNWDNHPLATFSSSNELALPFLTNYATKASTLSSSVSPTYGITDSKTGGDTRRVIELEAKYNF